MAFRSVRISQPSHLSVRAGQLFVKQKDKQVSVPFEDIATITLEDPAILLSVHVMRQAAEHGIVILTCDGAHMPAGIFRPFYTHSRQLSVSRMQLDLSKPFRKRCWQTIVQQKIRNQAICCELSGLKEVAIELHQIIPTVGSGDPTNREAYAARLYFSALYSVSFRRRDRFDWRNAALNYGYAVLRAGVARAVAEYGFMPAFGIHHCSELNEFNLADDFLEPFRPLVDLFVFQWAEEWKEGQSELSQALRLELAKLLHTTIIMNGEECSVLHAIDLMFKSFVSASREETASMLELPELINIRLHTYE